MQVFRALAARIMLGKKVFEVRNAAKAAARRSAKPFFGHFDSNRTYALMRATKDVIGGYACGGRDSLDDENTDTPAHS